MRFTEDMACKSTKQLFLSKKSNEQNFINLLGIKLQASGCTVIHAEEDADRLIVETAVESPFNHPTIVIADDTDVLILLIHYAPTLFQGLFLQNCRRMTSKKHGSVLNILQVRKDLGEDVCRHILFAHALLGCDTTSGIFGLGKAMTLEKVKQLRVQKTCSCACKCRIKKSGKLLCYAFTVTVKVT